MIFVGMDISSKDFVIHAVKDNKKVVINGQSYSPNKAGLRKMLSDLGKQTKLIVIEAGNQLKWIALYLKKQPGVHLHVVHPNEIKWITHSGKKKQIKLMLKKWQNLLGLMDFQEKFISLKALLEI